MMLPAKRSGTVYGARTIRSPPMRSSGMPSVHAVRPEMRYRTSTVALRFSSPVMSHSKPRQISVGGSITNWPVVTPVPARTGDVTITSASGTRMCFMELLPQLASASPRSARAFGEKWIVAWLIGRSGGNHLVSVALTALGLYGPLGYLVAERTKEIGIRIALCVRLARITGSVVANGLVLVAIGIAGS